MRSPRIRALIAIPLLAAGVLLSATLGHGTSEVRKPVTGASPLEAPVLTVESARGQLYLRGTTVSAAHESALLQLARDHFDGVETHTDFRPGLVLSDNWESASSRLLYALAAAESARAVMRNQSVEIRGVTSDVASFDARVAFLREELLPDTIVVTDVMTVKPAASHEVLCRRAFSGLFIEPVSFGKSSSDIRIASYGTLDRVIDFAYDCPQLTIAITGHTDASGDESWNVNLSLARAQAVADYIAGSGIDSQRLLVRGLGSAQPVADNDTAHGRSRNRRIEFGLR